MNAIPCPQWALDAVFYHLYPLGACGAPLHNDRQSPPQDRLSLLFDALPQWQALGVNALYIGPLFESSAHGYDTADYFHLDRRLGGDDLLTQFVDHCHKHGIRVILDGVFNHVGRDFWAFRDVREQGQDSPHCDWFRGLNFEHHSPYGDPFTYDGWRGCMDLVRLNLRNKAVKDHLLLAVEYWMEHYHIDGLRLDVAEDLPVAFLRELAAFCQQRDPDFWLMGEKIHGDYRRIAGPDTLHSATNYEVYKGLWSSHNDRNYFEIAYALQRQFGPEGVYRHLSLYNFVDNHDVSRVASVLRDPAHLELLYTLLFTIPGVPSIYYGSEWANRRPQKTRRRRLASTPPCSRSRAPQGHALARHIAQLAQLRHQSPALRHGDYQQVLVQSEQLAFLRHCPQEQVLVACNSASSASEITIHLPQQPSQVAALIPPQTLHHEGHQLRLLLAPNKGCLIRLLTL